MKYVETDSKYGSGVLLNEYGGKYSLVEARPRKDEDGHWIRFCRVEIRDQEVTLPKGVVIGNSRQEAIETLNHFVNLLESGGDEEDVPF